MTQSSHIRTASLLIAALAAIGLASEASAQAAGPKGDIEPWKDPAQSTLPKPKPPATSDLSATQATAQDDHKTRALAAAVFSRPAAALRAADKASMANASNIPPADPKPEWLIDREREARAAGGLEVSRPF